MWQFVLENLKVKTILWRRLTASYYKCLTAVITNYWGWHNQLLGSEQMAAFCDITYGFVKSCITSWIFGLLNIAILPYKGFKLNLKFVCHILKCDKWTENNHQGATYFFTTLKVKYKK